jgi:hypothetical protein
MAAHRARFFSEQRGVTMIFGELGPEVSEMTNSRYTTAGAFRSALTARLGAIAKDSRWTLHDLQRQFAYDRLLERLALIDQGWIMKGATALLARDLGVRGTTDIDLLRLVDPTQAENELRRAAALVLSDWFTFDVGSPTTVADGVKGLRIPITARVGTTAWSTFHVDVVGSGVIMTGVVESIPALAEGLFPEVGRPPYRVYPLVDHIADKLAEMYELHGSLQRPSTRFKDLVDLVAIVTQASIPALDQRRAVESEFARRALEIPDRLVAPDRQLWVRGYQREAKRSLLDIAIELDEALDLVGRYVNPVFSSTALGMWNPNQLLWVEG